MPGLPEASRRAAGDASRASSGVSAKPGLNWEVSASPPQLAPVETLQPQPGPAPALRCGTWDPLLGPELPAWWALSKCLLASLERCML